jgi:16S rRNA pseudouridine516 synthase
VGLTLGDGTKCLPARLEITGTDRCYVTVMEGKYHQVKRMLASCGKPVHSLRRLSVGGLHLDLKGPGDWRELSDEDLCKVFSKERLDK